MPSFRCRRCGACTYSAARLDRVAGGDRCERCGGRVVELRRRSLEDRQVGNVLYPEALRDVHASPIDPPIAGGRL